MTVLGCGTSTGVPVLGCDCAVCRSTHPRDNRLRASIYVEVPGRAHVLVDTTPDFRQQALRARIPRIDAVLFTHGHADHVLGLDDVRRFNVIQGGAIPCYASGKTWDTLRKTFYYVFADAQDGRWIPKLEPHDIDDAFDVNGVRVVPVPLLHGTMPVFGFRFGSFAYLTDCSVIPETSWPLVAGVDTLVIDALRDKPHNTHFTVEQALTAIERIAPRQAYLTHMTHDLGYEATSARLPGHVDLAYDGLVIDVDVDAWT